MRRLASVLAILVPALALAAPASAQESPLEPGKTGVPGKRAVAGSRLLLPYYEVDMSDPSGATTIFSVRNETLEPVEVTIWYHQTDRPQTHQAFETVTLEPKQLRSGNVRQVAGLVVDDDGFARGFVVIETTAGDPVIQGDYFQVSPGQAFATGNRLLNVDPESADNDLCSLFTVRFLNGGAFSGGTDFVIWLDLEVAPTGQEPVIRYAVRRESGDLVFSTELYRNEVAFKTKASDLVKPIPTAFGVIEFELLDGAMGHVSAVMSANGLYSVGLEAACGD